MRVTFWGKNDVKVRARQLTARPAWQHGAIQANGLIHLVAEREGLSWTERVAFPSPATRGRQGRCVGGLRIAVARSVRNRARGAPSPATQRRQSYHREKAPNAESLDVRSLRISIEVVAEVRVNGRMQPCEAGKGLGTLLECVGDLGLPQWIDQVA